MGYAIIITDKIKTAVTANPDTPIIEFAVATYWQDLSVLQIQWIDVINQFLFEDTPSRAEVERIRELAKSLRYYAGYDTIKAYYKFRSKVRKKMNIFNTIKEKNVQYFIIGYQHKELKEYPHIVFRLDRHLWWSDRVNFGTEVAGMVVYENNRYEFTPRQKIISK